LNPQIGDPSVPDPGTSAAVKNHIQAKDLSRHLVLTLTLVAGACSSGGGGSNGGNGGTQSTTGHGGSSSPGSGGSGVGGTQGAGGSGTGGSATGTGGSSTGSGGSAGSGAAGTTGGSGGSAGSGAAGADGGSGGRGGSGGSAGGGTAGANGGAGGRGGSGGSAGGSGGRGGGGGTAGAGGSGTGGGNEDGGATDAVMVMDGAVMNGVYVRTAWTATYTCTGTCPAQDSADTVDADTKRAFDGTLATRWSTGQYQQSTALMSKFPLYFTVDMHETVNISRIVMDPGNQDHYDAPGQMDVLVSLDGTNYTTIVSAHKPMTPSNGMPDDIMFTRTPARYIQLKATMTIKQVNNALGDRFWAIGEMNVYP
jgi:hypothetical protein